MRLKERESKFCMLLRKYECTPGALATKLNVSRGIVSHWMLGKRRPGTLHLIQISRALGCSIDEVAACYTDKGGRRNG